MVTSPYNIYDYGEMIFCHSVCLYVCISMVWPDVEGAELTGVEVLVVTLRLWGRLGVAALGGCG